MNIHNPPHPGEFIYDVYLEPASSYKIKLRTAGYRLAYEVIDEEIVVYVLAIGKRDKDAIYKKLASLSFNPDHKSKIVNS